MHLRGAWPVVVFVVWLIIGLISCRGGGAVQVVKIGGLVSVNSTIGQGVLASLQLAVRDVNANVTILPGVQLVLQTADTSCNTFQGAAAVVELLKGDVVAIAGPQTSTVAIFAAGLGAATQVPFVSFSATDPALTQSSNPFFLRTVHSDAVGMSALAAIIGLYGWREVAAVSTNDYVGLNSIDALSEALVPFGVTLAKKATFPSDISAPDISAILFNLSMLEARVFIVHLQPSVARLFFTTAQRMSMVTSGYVWIVSEALAGLLDDLAANDPIWVATQGMIGVRTYVPRSPRLTAFLQSWKAEMTMGANIYGMLAYDTVWMVARAMETWMGRGGNFTFIERTALTLTGGGGTDLASLKVLDKGGEFLEVIKGTKIDGVTGPIQFDEDGDLLGTGYEIVNLIGKSGRVVGYWSEEEGFSMAPLASSPSSGSESAMPSSPIAASQLEDVIWPGGSAQVPKGWAVAKNGEQLLIGVPYKTGFPEFVDIKRDPAINITSFHGFCIDVFEAAVSFLPYELNYTYVPYGNGTVTPSYDSLVDKVVEKEFDAVVGDVTITTDRSKIVDFTQPYTASGLVVVVPTKSDGNHAWAFMRPFTPLMWATTGLFFLFTGLAIWILEHKKNKDFRGKPQKQFVVVLWFIFSTLFFSQREKTKSTLGRAVLIIWLFVVLIVISSYTASLTSILTVQQLQPTVEGIAGLVTSNLVIGYQVGSFVQDYLLQMNVPQSRLVPLGNQTEFADALAKGTVGAIVDELPYVQVFLATECRYTISGQEFTKSGWGFAFPKGSPLAVDMSTAILTLAENGHLQQIHDYWLKSQGCSSSGLEASSNELGLGSFWGLFLITGACSVTCVLLYYSRLIWQHHKNYRDCDTESERSLSRSARHKSFLRSLVTYIEESEVVARQDALGAGNRSQRKTGKEKRRSEFGLESEAGGSGRSDELAPTAPETPEHHLDNPY